MLEKPKSFFITLYKDGIETTLQKTYSYLNPTGKLLDIIRIKLFCDIDRGLASTIHLPHPIGIVVNSSTEIGENVSINSNVTIGVKTVTGTGCPEICDNVRIWSGAVIVGDIRIGEGAVIGANSVVVEDVPDGAIVAGAPATGINNDDYANSQE